MTDMKEYYKDLLITCEFFTTYLQVRRLIANSTLITRDERIELMQLSEIVEKYKK